MGLALDAKFGEAPGGVNLWPDPATGLWTLVDEMNGVGVVGRVGLGWPGGARCRP